MLKAHQTTKIKSYYYVCVFVRKTGLLNNYIIDYS